MLGTRRLCESCSSLRAVSTTNGRRGRVGNASSTFAVHWPWRADVKLTGAEMAPPLRVATILYTPLVERQGLVALPLTTDAYWIVIAL